MSTRPQLARRPHAVGLAKAAIVHAPGARRRGPREGRRDPACASSTTTASRPAATRWPSRRTRSAARWTTLAASGQRVLDLYEIDDLTLEPGEAAVALTFDDGFRDVLQHALPVLREHGFPSTVFVVPGVIDGHERLRLVRRAGTAAGRELGRAPRGGARGSRALRAPHAHASRAHESAARGGPARDRALQAGGRARARPARRGSSATRAATTRAREVELVRASGYRAAVTCEYGANQRALRPQRAAPRDRRALRSALAVPRAPRRRDRRAAARQPQPPPRAPGGVTPRLLVVVTLAEAGGAQTFAATLVAGLRERYAIEVAAHGPGGALVDACAALDVPFHHVRHLVRDPHPVPRRGGGARAARADPPDRARHRPDQLLQGRRPDPPRGRAASETTHGVHRARLGVLGPRRRRGSAVRGGRARRGAAHRRHRLRLEPRPGARSRARHPSRAASCT